MDHYMEPDAETYSEKLSPTDVNPRNSKSTPQSDNEM